MVAGFLVARTGDVLAAQTGLEASLVGVVLVAIATSRPEVSTTLAAVRLGEYEMAFSNIFGTNLFDVLLIFLVDAFYQGGPVLNEVGRSSVFGALLGIAVTTVYLAGLVEPRDRVILRMGVDPLVVPITCLRGVALLYQLR